MGAVFSDHLISFCLMERTIFITYICVFVCNSVNGMVLMLSCLSGLGEIIIVPLTSNILLCYNKSFQWHSKEILPFPVFLRTKSRLSNG